MAFVADADHFGVESDVQEKSKVTSLGFKVFQDLVLVREEFRNRIWPWEIREVVDRFVSLELRGLPCFSPYSSEAALGFKDKRTVTLGECVLAGNEAAHASDHILLR